MNIQDPFVLNHNIAQNLNEKARDATIREFRIAAIKTSVWGNEGFSVTSPSGVSIQKLTHENKFDTGFIACTQVLYL